jgi:hypothetical protein
MQENNSDLNKNQPILEKGSPLTMEAIDQEIFKIEEKLKSLAQEIAKLEELEKVENESKNKNIIEAEKIENVVIEAIEEINEENDRIIEEKIAELSPQTLIDIKKDPSIFKKILDVARKKLEKKLVKYVYLPATVIMAIAFSYHTPQEYNEMWQNWKERHIERIDVDDPNIVGVDALYKESTNIERTTYDFIGKDKINYKFGYYMTSVFDLSDRTPPRFKIINNRENYSKIDSAAGITTNLFEGFVKVKDFEPKLKGHLDRKSEEIGDIPVVGYNIQTQTMRAGHFKEFDDNWLVSETYEIPLNFKLNEDSTINLTYPPSTLRMCPLTTNEKGKQIPFPIGITRDKTIKAFNPYKATHFGVLEGGKVIMVCGDKQLQVNGSFADMFHVYERLQKENKGLPIQAYLLDNGSYNLPIWNKDNILTEEEIREHLTRHRGGGTALVLINDNKISPYEYKNEYKEFEHYTPIFTLDSLTGKPAKNEKEVIVIHHTGNYKDPNEIIRQFEGKSKREDAIEGSSHVLIMKDGTRHLFNTDDYVLAHAGKSDFNDKNKVNYFSLGIELEGDSNNKRQFTVAQIESMLEYMRPRIEKYNIPLSNITTHKIIRDNYIKKHPNEKGVLIKTDLDDQVWEQIKKLIEKKLYESGKITLDKKAKKMIGSLAYRETYRLTNNKNLALYQAEKILTDLSASKAEIGETLAFINTSA